MGIVEVGLERTIDTRASSRPSLRVETIEVLECIKSSATSCSPDSRVRDRDVVFGMQYDGGPHGLMMAERLLSPRNTVVDDVTTVADYCYATGTMKQRMDIHTAGTTNALRYRTSSLLVLMVLQSVSSFILSKFQPLIMAHPCIIVFLTMLIGAGGNAGSQSTVLTVRAITEFSLHEKSCGHSTSTTRALKTLVWNEFMRSFRIAAVITLACYLRVQLVAELSTAEVAGLSLSMFAIVFTSIIMGTLMPLSMWKCGMDPAHAGAAIQVFADVSGVSLTCFITGLVTFLMHK